MTLFRSAFESSPFAGIIFDDRGIVLETNAEFRRLGGYEKDRLAGANMKDIVHPQDYPSFLKNLKILRPGGTEKCRIEKRILFKNGESRPFGVTTSLIEKDQNGGRYFVSVLEETPKPDSPENRAAKTEDRYEKLFNSLSDAIYIHDATGRILEANNVACEQTGYEKNELLQIPVLTILPEDASSSRIEIMNRLVRSKDFYEARQIAKNGSATAVEASAREIVFNGEPAVMTVARDITYRKELEAQLLQSQKMEAVGRLAGGIAHDFNNLMTAVISFAGFLLSEVDDNHPMRADLLEIEKAGKRAANLTKQLLAFSRKQVMNISVIDLNDLIRCNEEMIRKVMSERVTAVFSLAPDLWWIKADSVHMELVLFNLAVNAKEAMPMGGKLEIKTENVAVAKNDGFEDSPTKPGDYVKWTISDTGQGMDRDTLFRIFEPFFTTKTAGKGTGLSLSTVYGIVAQTKGSVYVQSEPGCGTVFSIFFPRAFHSDACKRKRERQTINLTGSETVLVVEDENSIRKLARKVFSKSGYNPIIAANGEEAVGICENYPEEIHLMLADIVMPGLTGRQLIDKVSATRPNMKILFMSGHPSYEILHYDLVDWKENFLPKPFSAESLLKKTRQMLDK